MRLFFKKNGNTQVNPQMIILKHLQLYDYKPSAFSLNIWDLNGFIRHSMK